ncbi:RNA polymerase sigma factor [Flavivirga jejuensis]|uniref:Sigma-70 family RNA polymerase sigma factor n=1 Tax=Flavivirga jejuensis TaxID=870487 RepID=A0ABT8WTB4_9FLAO|nr:sigma-70 family RNA polymerase sigma factor [Flavivirga jejuensis]MDO5976240.1 sigma-70 family RNA polymerase sigma factor [Flavivirga jejuensis]
MTEHSDQLLFNSLKEGSDDDFKKVYNDNRPMFLNFAKKYGIAEEDILDIYQDAYIVFYENIQTGKLAELRSSLATYLMSIGKYMILDKLRKNKKKVDGYQILERVEEVDLELDFFDIIQPKLSKEQVLLKDYFDKLGERCQQILTWFYYKKYNIKEIMSAGNYKSENVVKSQKSRCLKTLKESMIQNINQS